MPNYGAPTPPTGLPAEAATRILAARVEVSDAIVDALRATGAAVELSADALAEHGRDWWPLSIGWAVHDAALAARPAVVVTPQHVEQVADVLRLAQRHTIPVTAMAGRSGV